MKPFLEMVRLELLSLVRSKTLAMLAVAALVWTVAFPWLVTGDGTAAGARELDIRYSLGGVFVLLVLALLGSATASVARERTSRRLQLTLVRPVRGFAVALSKMTALVFAGGVVLVLAAAALACRVDLSARCNHVLAPVLPSPREEARLMYEDYMKDPKTPAEVKRAKPATVLRLLTQRALDHYQTVPAGGRTAWRFDLPDGESAREGLAVRLRFTNQMEMRQTLLGAFRLGNLTASVSNITQAVLLVPLAAAGTVPEGMSANELTFENAGKAPLMLRPRKDICLLQPADTFAANLARSVLGLLAVLAIILSVGVFLSSALGRPVALFVALVALAVGEMSPSVMEQYPDTLETGTLDRIGLEITRFATAVTHPVSALSPLERLSKDECVERTEVLKVAALGFVVLPLALSLLAGFVMPRKQDDD